MAKDPATYFRATIGVLVDAIRISDFKANIAIVFVGIMMGPVLGARDKFPSYFSLAMVMAPFLPAALSSAAVPPHGSRKFGHRAKCGPQHVSTNVKRSD